MIVRKLSFIQKSRKRIFSLSQEGKFAKGREMGGLGVTRLGTNGYRLLPSLHFAKFLIHLGIVSFINTIAALLIA